MFFAQVQGFNPELASAMFLANMYRLITIEVWI